MTNCYNLTEEFDALREAVARDSKSESIYILDEREREENGNSADRERRP